MKKSQITLFIIIGLILFIVIGGLLYFVRPVDTKLDIFSEFTPVYTYLDECLAQTSLMALSLMGAQGGYIELPSDYLHTNYSDIPYLLPTLADMELELSSYLEKANCTNFEIFKNLEIIQGIPKAKVSMKERSVKISIDYDLRLIYGDVEQLVEERIYESAFPMAYLHALSSEIILNHNPNWIDLSYFDDKDIKVQIIAERNDTLIFVLNDDVNHTFLFAQYIRENDPPVLELDDVYTISEGEPFIMKIEAEGEGLIFTDNTALFDITENGVIIFTPEIAGRYDIMIRVTDNLDNFDEEKTTFVII